MNERERKKRSNKWMEWKRAKKKNEEISEREREVIGFKSSIYVWEREEYISLYALCIYHFGKDRQPSLSVIFVVFGNIRFSSFLPFGQIGSLYRKFVQFFFLFCFSIHSFSNIGFFFIHSFIHLVSTLFIFFSFNRFIFAVFNLIN